MPPPPEYKIIYNWDDAPHTYHAFPQSTEDFLSGVYDVMEKTQVGAHFWCLGIDVARWKSQVMPMVGQIQKRRYAGADQFTQNENILAMLERGEDPQKAVIRRGHELGLHAYASVRMNDNHYRGAQIDDLPQLRLTERTKIRKEHPEWLLGDQTSEWFALSLNMALPEVREYRFQYIEEFCRLYDWDGVELDWQRHGFHLPKDQAYRLKYTLTDLQRAVRRMANNLSRKRGKPFYVAARVSGTLEMCSRIGYDVPAWIEENLVDVLIPAGCASSDPSVDVASFVQLCQGTHVVVYPGFDAGNFAAESGPEDPHEKDKMLNRAIANRYHRDGAKGIYLFNWHGDGHVRRELMNQMGSPQTLARTDKIYGATYRHLQPKGEWRGAFRNDRIWGEVPVDLKPSLTEEDGPTFRIDIADDPVTDGAQRTELRLRLDQWVNDDQIRVLLDGSEMINGHWQYHIDYDRYANQFAAPLQKVGSAAWFTYPLTATQAASGAHEVKVILDQRNPHLENAIVVTDVEILIKYCQS